MDDKRNNQSLRYAKEYKGYLINPRMGRYDIYVEDRGDWSPLAGWWQSEDAAKAHIDTL